MGKTVSAFRVAYQRKIISIWENIRHYPQIKESRGTGQISASPGYSFCSVKCRWWDSNPHTLADNRFWVIQAIRNLMAWTGIKRSFPSLSKTSKTRKSLIKSAFSTQSTKSTSNSSPPRLSAARYPIWGAGGMLEGCKQDIPPANSYRGHTH